MDKQSRRENLKKNMGRQFKGLVKPENNLANAIAMFAVGALLLVAGTVTGIAFLGLIGGGCVILGLERLVRRSADKNGDVVSDLRYRETNREDDLRK